MKYNISCLDCNSQSVVKLKWKPYKEFDYKCKDCKTLWDRNTKYCIECLDVIQYCKCC